MKTRLGLAFAVIIGVMISGTAPAEGASQGDASIILTPAPGPAPQINGPRVFGARPGHPFTYRIPCTGTRPIRFSAVDLPEGLVLDSSSGIISGRVPGKPGRYRVTLKAENGSGASERPFVIVVGSKLALTPPMGWNSWYIHYDRVTDAVMREAADMMVASGMADFGYMYVNIDDCWMNKPGHSDPLRAGEARDGNGAILPNGYFPDMKAMTDYIHAKGLRAGLYTSPGPTTCAGYTGSYEHERLDAEQFAEWGFDFLKYDWCSYERVATGEGLPRLEKPYRLMGGVLGGLDRDVLLNLCQYGMGDVWNWGESVGGQCWRTTGDLGLEAATSLPGFYSIGLKNAAHFANAGPGAWNDPDYILIGWVGDAHRMGEGRPTTLSGNEQYSYMSMWALMAAPLIFSGDMSRLDDFTLNVLCNAEIIDVDQDSLGRQARVLRQTAQEFVLAKPLEDGSVAVGLFNLSGKDREMKVGWAELGLSRVGRVRDLWRQVDLEGFRDEFYASIGPHGVMVVRLFPSSSSGGGRYRRAMPVPHAAGE